MIYNHQNTFDNKNLNDYPINYLSLVILKNLITVLNEFDCKDEL